MWDLRFVMSEENNETESKRVWSDKALCPEKLMKLIRCGVAKTRLFPCDPELDTTTKYDDFVFLGCMLSCSENDFV